MNFNNLRVATKLWIAVGIIMLALVSLLLGASMRAASQQAQMDTTLADLNTRTKMAMKWFGATQANSVRAMAVVISSDPAVEATFKGTIAETTAQISEVQKSIEAMQLTGEEKTQMEKIAASRKNVITLRDGARQLRADGKADEALQMINAQYIPAQKAYVDTLRELVQIEEKEVAAFMSDMACAKLSLPCSCKGA